MHFKILLVVLLSVLSLQIWCGIVDDERNKTLAEVFRIQERAYGVPDGIIAEEIALNAQWVNGCRQELPGIAFMSGNHFSSVLRQVATVRYIIGLCSADGFSSTAVTGIVQRAKSKDARNQGDYILCFPPGLRVQDQDCSNTYELYAQGALVSRGVLPDSVRDSVFGRRL